MKASPFGASIQQLFHGGRHQLDVHSERLGSTTHFHARTLEIKVRIDADRKTRLSASRLPNLQRPSAFARRFNVDRHAGLDRLLQFIVSLSGSGKADLFRRCSCFKRDPQFAAGCDIDTIGQPHHLAEQRRKGIGFHRIMQIQRIGHRSTDTSALAFRPPIASSPSIA